MTIFIFKKFSKFDLKHGIVFGGVVWDKLCIPLPQENCPKERERQRDKIDQQSDKQTTKRQRDSSIDKERKTNRQEREAGIQSHKMSSKA